MALLVTKLEIERAIGEKTLRVIADDDRDGVADPDVVDGAIAYGSSLAESYLRDYLPITSPSEALKGAVIAIAVQQMRLARDRTTEDSRRAYEAAIQWLRDLASEKAALALPGDGSGSGAPLGGAYDPDAPEVDTQDRIWDRRIAGRVF